MRMKLAPLKIESRLPFPSTSARPCRTPWALAENTGKTVNSSAISSFLIFCNSFCVVLPDEGGYSGDFFLPRTRNPRSLRPGPSLPRLTGTAIDNAVIYAHLRSLSIGENPDVATFSALFRSIPGSATIARSRQRMRNARTLKRMPSSSRSRYARPSPSRVFRQKSEARMVVTPCGRGDSHRERQHPSRNGWITSADARVFSTMGS